MESSKRNMNKGPNKIQGRPFGSGIDSQFLGGHMNRDKSLQYPTKQTRGHLLLEAPIPS